MALKPRYPKRDTVTLGDDQAKGERPYVYGLLADIRDHEKFSDKKVYEIVEEDGTNTLVSGCGALDAQLGPECVGAFVELTFTGWGANDRGKFRSVKVQWDTEPTEAMKRWPRWKEINKKRTRWDLDDADEARNDLAS